MSGRARIDAFLKTAEEDLQASEALAKLGNRLAAFHIQQALEKTIKSALLRHNVEAGVEHNLDVLLKRLPDDDPTRQALWPLRSYGGYATTFRYPTSTGRLVDAPPKKEIDAAVAAIRGHLDNLRERVVEEHERTRDDDDDRSRRRR